MKHTLSAIALIAALGAPAGAQQQVAATTLQATRPAADDLLMTSVLPAEKKTNRCPRSAKSARGIGATQL